jgi:hypothetical protein
MKVNSISKQIIKKKGMEIEDRVPKNIIKERTLKNIIKDRNQKNITIEEEELTDYISNIVNFISILLIVMKRENLNRKVVYGK